MVLIMVLIIVLITEDRKRIFAQPPFNQPNCPISCFPTDNFSTFYKIFEKDRKLIVDA